MSKPLEATLFVLNVRSLSFSQAVQEIDLRLSDSSVVAECSVADSLLPTHSPLHGYPHIVSMQYSDGQLLCCTSHGVFYVFALPDLSKDDSINSFSDALQNPQTSHLPMEFQTRGSVETTSGIRFAFYLRGPCLLKNETDTEIDTEIESVLVWHRNGQLSYSCLSDETHQEEFFPYLDEIIYCDHGDRGHIQASMNLPNFFLFMKSSLLTVGFHMFSYLSGMDS